MHPNCDGCLDMHFLGETLYSHMHKSRAVPSRHDIQEDEERFVFDYNQVREDKKSLEK
jgi:hypothetical protein